jgi:hypothetical protein
MMRSPAATSRNADPHRLGQRQMHFARPEFFNFVCVSRSKFEPETSRELSFVNGCEQVNNLRLIATFPHTTKRAADRHTGSGSEQAVNRL